MNWLIINITIEVYDNELKTMLGNEITSFKIGGQCTIAHRAKTEFVHYD